MRGTPLRCSFPLPSSKMVNLNSISFLNSDLFWAFGPILGLFDAINGFVDVYHVL
jgi:hypothetical protein